MFIKTHFDGYKDMSIRNQVAGRWNQKKKVYSLFSRTNKESTERKYYGNKLICRLNGMISLKGKQR